MSFISAIRFLTRIPIPWCKEASRKEFAGSLLYYPFVGIIIGLMLWGGYVLLSPIAPSLIVTLLLVASLVFITGGMHLDGLADTIDGVAASHKEESVWKRVMHEPTIGTFGVVGIVLVLFFKVIALGYLPHSMMGAMLVLMPVLGRWTMVYSIFFYSYARESGIGSELKKEMGVKGFAIATITALAAAFITAEYIGLIIAAAVWLSVIMVAAFLKNKFGGLTGDTYGFINELAECLVLLLAVMASYNSWF